MVFVLFKWTSNIKVVFHAQFLKTALAQALRGRLHILGEMRKVMTKPNATLSDLVPQIVSFRVMKDRIGAIIGKGGATIKEITAKTGTSVDIEDDGLVKIFGHPGEKMDEAVRWVKVLGGQLEAGMRFEGKVKRIAELGCLLK